MHSAIGSRKDFNNLDEDQLLAEYKVCLEGLLEHEQVLKLTCIHSIAIQADFSIV